jgi:hypothetical protein
MNGRPGGWGTYVPPENDLNWINLVPHTEPRNVLGVFRFRGEPGREKDAAEAWAFELTYYFLRAVGEAPQVEYQGGVYTCTGLMTTTHPADTAPVTIFNRHAEPSDLNWVLSPWRQERLRELHDRRPQQLRFDGRDVT